VLRHSNRSSINFSTVQNFNGVIGSFSGFVGDEYSLVWLSSFSANILLLKFKRLIRNSFGSFHLPYDWTVGKIKLQVLVCF
jgi:hypothetical protein